MLVFELARQKAERLTMNKEALYKAFEEKYEELKSPEKNSGNLCWLPEFSVSVLFISVRRTGSGSC